MSTVRSRKPRFYVPTGRSEQEEEAYVESAPPDHLLDAWHWLALFALVALVYALSANVDEA